MIFFFLKSISNVLFTCTKRMRKCDCLLKVCLYTTTNVVELRFGPTFNHNYQKKLCIHTTPRGVNSSLETQMTCVGRCEIKPPLCEKFREKNKCMSTNGMLGNGLMYLY